MTNYERLKRYSKKELIEKIIVRDKHCNDLKDLLAKGLERYKLLEEDKALLLSDYEWLLKDKRELEKENKELKEENMKLNEFKVKREENVFYFKAKMERVEPKTAREAEDLQRVKELFEKLYRKELCFLEEENKELKNKCEHLTKIIAYIMEREDICYIDDGEHWFKIVE